MSAFKDFHTYHEQTVGFRFDAFNAFNIVSYGNPDTGITDSTFGADCSAGQIRSTERRLQFSLHYAFLASMAAAQNQRQPHSTRPDAVSVPPVV